MARVVRSGQTPQEWTLIVLSYWCPDCDSGPGRRCITRRGAPKSEPHVARVDVVSRCKRCKAWLHADWPFDVCYRCAALLRLDPDDPKHRA